MKYLFRETVVDAASGKSFVKGHEYEESEIPGTLMATLEREKLIVKVEPVAATSPTPKLKPAA